MTVICMDCKRNISEKCSACGAPSHRLLFQEVLLAREGMVNLYGTEVGKKALWVCETPACNTTSFPEGQGGISHGLCKDCSEVRYNQLEP